MPQVGAHHEHVAEHKPMGRHRVFVPQALGSDEFLRVTWHESDRVVVFSHWQGDICIAATPVLVTDTTDLTALLVDALGDAANHPIVPAPPRAPTLRERFLHVLHRAHRDEPAAHATTRRWSRSA
jgi:hypothetical protein